VKVVRLGAVDYLNARPLVYGLELHSRDFALRFDAPSKCAALLHEGSIDVGLIPSIEYLRGHENYRIVPGVGIVSDGAVASVALFTTKPLDQIRSIAADTSSRTSSALLRVLGYEVFGLEAELVPIPPHPTQMLRRCDAALIIGDVALFFDHAAAGVTKFDLGEAWTTLTGLPFVWAFWAGRQGALTEPRVDALVHARDAGVAASELIAAAYCGPGRAERGQAYLRENMRYTLGEREEAGLRRFYDLAEQHGIVEDTRPLAYYRSS
jgi:chorismate dehydratase